MLSAVSGADLLPLERSQCLLLLSDSITYEAEPSRLWLYNLYLRYTADSSSAESGEVQTTDLLTLSGGSTWCEQVTLQGDGSSAVRGASVTAGIGSEAGGSAASFSGKPFRHAPAVLCAGRCRIQ